MRDESDALFAAERWLSQSHAVALATVLSTWGSAPRQPGSVLAIRDDGAFVGSVSSGCVEGAVVEAGLAAIADGKPRQLQFGVADAQAWSVGLACGGSIAVFVEFVSADLSPILQALNNARRCNKAMVRAVDLTTGISHLIDPEVHHGALPSLAREGARHGRSGLVECDGKAWFLSVFTPAIDLAVVGAVHIAQPLAKMAALLGYRVRLIDPRAAFATTERFPDVPLFLDYPDAVFREVPLGPHSAVVALAHDPKIDDPALEAAFASPAFYIGALGSKKNQAARLERMKARGFSHKQLARLHGPVGLAIGSKSPEEIAVSIVAEITQVLRLQ